ncbi:MAG TPA: lipoyl(octanoyl) transferase LipB [Thermodesulfobacteriota bacterium]|nr:lipoyl(octanoyl) transferase LipB [Thermodesulfobacteriota bacterium]
MSYPVIIESMTDSLDNRVEWAYIGEVDYLTALHLQRELWRRVLSNDDRSGFLLLCEHRPVITIGRFGKETNILLSKGDLKKRGIEVHRIERGGDVTFHGPGQLVGYPIVNLRDFKLGARSYVHLLEETLIAVLRGFGIQGGRIEGYPGVWIGEEKIAAIGVYVKRLITMHGFSLNVNTDLGFFSLIVPCGIRRMGVTSMKRVTGKEFPLKDVALILVNEFGKTFKADMKATHVSERDKVAILRRLGGSSGV